MRNRTYSIAVVSTVVTLLGSLLGTAGCSDPEGRDLHLMPKPAEELTAEAERLRQMQMVRGVYTDQDPCGQDPTAVFHRLDFVWNIMQAKLVSAVSVPTENPLVCNYVMEVEAEALAWLSFLSSFQGRSCALDDAGNPVPVWRYVLCDAQTLRDAGAIRANPLKVDGTGGSIAFPPQTTAARAGLLRAARFRARQAAFYASQALRAGGGCGTLCSEIATSYVEAYHLFQEIADEEVEATLATADAQRSLSSSVAQGVDWSISGTALSRAAAAHALVGGDAGLRPPQGLPGGAAGTTPDGGFCSAPELTPQVQKAITVIREAAPSPAVIIAPITSGTGAGSMSELLISTTLSTGSLRARLGQSPKYPEFGPGCTTVCANTPDTFAGFFGLKVNDFAAAREYLAQEIRTFSRSLTAQINPTSTCTTATQAAVCATGSTCTSGSCSTKPERIRWAATSGPPQPIHPVYWATIGAYTTASNPLSTAPVPTEVTDQDLSTFVDAAASEAGVLMTFVNTSSTVPAAEKAPAQNVLATLADDANQNGRRRIDYCRTVVWDTFHFWGYTATDGLRVVRGEDGLRCAIYGNIEGAPCSLTTTLMPTVIGAGQFPQPASSGYTTFLENNIGTMPPVGERFYVVKPRVAGQTGPGDWEVISGDTYRATNTCSRVPVFPRAQRRAADALAPSRSWCTQSAVECDGTRFDERMPLENELSDDGDDVESSWKHYLALARQAADEADALGTQYINDAIASDQRAEEVQLRDFSKQERVEAILSEIQDICGTDLETDDLLALLGGGLENMSPATPTPGRTYTQTPGGLLVLDSHPTLSNAKDNSQSLRRLWECIGTDTRIQYATLGSVPLCFNFDPASNQLCVGKTIDACPKALTDNSTGCPADIPTKTMTELKYFDTDSTNPPQSTSSKELCKSVRILQATPNNIPELDKLRGSEFFNTPLMESVAKRIGFEPRFGAYAAVTVDGSPRYTTGDYFATRDINLGPAGPPVWPCAPAAAGTCPAGGAGLFCSNATCTNNLASRAAFNDRLMRAVIALHAVSVNSYDAFKNVRIPVYVLDRKLGSVHIGNVVNAPTHWGWANDSGYPRNNGSMADYGWPGNFAFTTSAETLYPQTGSSLLVRIHNMTGIKAKGIVDGKPLVRSDQLRTKDMSFTVYEMPAGGTGSAAWIDKNNVTWNAKMSLVPGPGIAAALFSFGVADAIMFREDVSPYDDARHGNIVAGGAGWYEALNRVEPKQGPGRDPSSVHAYLISLMQSATLTPPTSVRALELPFGGIFNQYGGIPTIGFYESVSLPAVTVPALNKHTTPDFTYDRQSLLDGLELACEIGNEDQNCDLSQLPPFAAENLEPVSRYIRCGANAIIRRGATAVLRDLPERAVDALRKESVNGTYPAIGGLLGGAVTDLRVQLSALPGIATTVSIQLGLLADDVDTLKTTLRRADVQAEIIGLKTKIETATRDAACMAAILNNNYSTIIASGGGSIVQAASTCMDMAQLNSLSRELAAKEGEDAKLVGAQALIDFRKAIRGHAETLSGLSERLSGVLERVDGALTEIDRLRNKASFAVRRALFVSSQQAEQQEAISTAMKARRDVAKERYKRARKSAVLMAFLARRAIEQRLGVRLSELRQDFPLAGSPATWASTVCSSSGIDYSQLTNPDGGPFESLADSFIGDYVTKLENFVEGYRLTVGFHEGTDTAVVSLRDDIQKVRVDCPTPSDNLLYRSGDLDALQQMPGIGPGWNSQNCRAHATEGAVLPDCVTPLAIEVPPAILPELPQRARAFELRFGKEGTSGADCATLNTCGLKGRPAFAPFDSSAIAQTVRLPRGKYLLSWYESLNFTSGTITQSDPTAEPIRIRFEDGTEIAPMPSSPDIATWRRFRATFDNPNEQNITLRIVQSLDTAPARPLRRVAGFMLEDVSNVPSTQALIPKPYTATGDTTDTVVPVCEDTEGVAFRRKHWERGCVRLCADGFSTNCGDKAETHCYRETSFHLSQWAIEKDGILGLAGFARGNFNYRINSVGLNFVGTNTRDCEGSNTPSTCFGGGFMPYSIAHVGPYFIRNHEGADVPLSLFEGNIEHARGLATERYLTNPFSESDRGLIEPYMRRELVGRPMDGTYVIRVWEEPGVNFDAIRDVQIVLNYSYWTRFN